MALSVFFLVTYVPHPHLPSRSGMTESSIDRERKKERKKERKERKEYAKFFEDQDRLGNQRLEWDMEFNPSNM